MKHKTNSVIGIALGLLVACSPIPVVVPVDVPTLEAEADRALERGDYAAARAALEQLVPQAQDDSLRRYQLQLARTLIGLGDAAGALTLLDGISPPLPDALRPELMALRAEALFALGNTSEAVRLLVEREIWLDSPAAILENQTLIWNGLASAPPAAAGIPPTGDETIDGWLALAPLTRLTQDQNAFLAALVDWRDRYPNHPAVTGILAERLAALRGPGLRPGRLALLLPLSGQGDRRLQAEAIRDGVFAARLATADEQAPDIRIFDTAANDALTSYRAAQIDAADFIIGPLIEDTVRQVESEAGLIPTLALNIDTQGNAAPANFYQFALASDDEIDAIATRAVAAGLMTAVVLYRTGDRGRRLERGFREAFESRGGHIIDSREYAGESTELADRVEALLGVSQSDARFERLRGNLRPLGLTIEFEPRRRQDIDMIFIQAESLTGPEDARLLVPLLAENDAADIPTYATPEVYDPRRERRDSDLDGLIFPGLPMLVDPVGTAQTAADLLTQFTSRSAAEYRRLFAFGYDAYQLAELLFEGRDAQWPLLGATGELYLGENGRIHRILPFAEFSGGRPEPLGPITDLPSEP